MDTQSVIDQLKQRKKELGSRRAVVERLYYGLLLTVIGLLIFAPLGLLIRGELKLTLVSLAYLLAFVPLILYARSRLHSIDEQIQNLDFELDLQQYDVTVSERRAEKILRIHQAQLRRYYDLNLSQNVWLFIIGVLCIVLGAAVVALTCFWITRTAAVQEKIIIASLGGIGAILTNFVAAIYLKMHATASNSLNVFHSKLVESQELLVSNLLASRIEDEQKRWDTLSEVSKSIVQRGKNAVDS